jgi:carboxypeptidase C (cathepsin A)
MVSFNRTPGAQRNDFDPSWVQRPVYTQMFTQYVRDDLGYKTDDVYGGGIAGWNYDGYGQNMSQLLESAFAKNPYMKLLLATGYYDFACPFFEAEYSMHHLFLPPDIQKNITVEHYEVGHMIYQDEIARKALESDVRNFIANSEHPTAVNLEPR